MNIIPAIKKEKYILISFLLFSFITLLLGTKSSPIYVFNDWEDVNAYFTMGKGWMNGCIPYKDLFDHKGPLLYIIYGIGYIISNDSFWGIYILQCIAFTTILYFMYKLSGLFLSKQYAYIASLSFSIIYFATNLRGGSAEEFILLFQTIGLYLLFKHFIDKNNPRNLRYIFIQGILIGCVALIKINIIIFWFIPLLAIIIQTIIDKNFKLAVRYFLLTTLGVLLVIAPFVCYFFAVDSLSDFWESYIIFNTIYASIGSDLNAFSDIPIEVLKTHPLALSYIILGISYFTFSRNVIKERVFRFSLFPMFGILYLSIFRSAYYDYYIMSVSVLSILGIVTIASIIQKRYNNVHIKYFIISILLIIGINVVLKRKMIKNINSYNYQIEFSQYMKEHIGEKELSILNLGMDEGYFFLTNTIPPNKYFYLPNISYSQYPQIIDTNIEIMKSDKAPLYITISRYITINNVKTDMDIYLPVIEAEYDVVKEYTSYAKWPAYQHILYKRKN
ncbi:glycosyltransferase family 39 protein [Dysgonomonas alginatilytica]|nr:glycosyltransferase family 39 protein [Dysgonomonas alginatilytica]